MNDTCPGCGREGDHNEPCPQCQRPATCSKCHGAGIVLKGVRIGDPKITHHEYNIMAWLRSYLRSRVRPAAMTPERLAEQRAMKDFGESKPGVRYDKTNVEHERFMDRQIKAHISLMERNRKQREYGGQW